MAAAPTSSLVAARVDARRKAAFAALAMRQGLSESALLNAMIGRVLEDNAAEASDPRGDRRRSDKLTLRLRRGDRHRLDAVARLRGLRSSTYVAVLLRAHLGRTAPLTPHEIVALKQCVNELTAGVRRLTGACSTTVDVPLPSIEQVTAALDAVRRDIADLVRANLIWWENQDA
jgi:hypothetical protein